MHAGLHGQQHLRRKPRQGITVHFLRIVANKSHSLKSVKVPTGNQKRTLHERHLRTEKPGVDVTRLETIVPEFLGKARSKVGLPSERRALRRTSPSCSRRRPPLQRPWPEALGILAAAGGLSASSSASSANESHGKNPELRGSRRASRYLHQHPCWSNPD